VVGAHTLLLCHHHRDLRASQGREI
jgi:hypothetical protein